MKTLGLIFLLAITMPWAWAEEDCFFCGILNLPSRIFPRPAVRDIQRVVEPLVDIQTPPLRRNSAAEYCRRDEDLVDTVVFHHSGGPSTQTITTINDGHVNRESNGRPWLMIGYHYAINSPYSGSRGSTTVSQGRPFNISGAHLGSDSYSNLSTSTRRLLTQDSNLECGVQGRRFSTPDDRFRNGKGKANYTTVGVVVIGNYAQVAPDNPGGYRRGRPRYPSSSALETAGRLACEIQRRHPRVTNISWHNAYKSTDCPGTIRQRIQQIKDVARRFGCTFN